jgi:hypothetical protein
LLAVTSSQRVVGSSVPTLRLGLPGFEMVGWFAIVARVGARREA